MISGKQGSGKSSLSRAICQHLNETRADLFAKQIRFAAPLYEMHEACRKVAMLYGIPFDEKEGRLLQLIGTEWGRTVKGENTWVNALREMIKVYKMREELAVDFDETIYVIDDCRFKNEFYGFKDEAYTIRLIAPEEARKVRTHAWRSDTTHPSEIDLDGIESEFDLVIDTHENSKIQTFNLAMNGYFNFEGKQ